jgi:glycosyltransferase involved in cell wall biosynthesis
MTTAFAVTPSVSVILPTFNRLLYLRPAVASVFAQTLVDWELIIADDGSDEPTRAYLSALQSEPRVRLIWLPHCGNPAAVRNRALRQARGEYLAFLDSDDEWLPTKLERQITALRGCPQRRWSYTGYIIIDASGEPCAPASVVRPHRGAILERLLMHQVSIWTPAVVAERRLVAEVGSFDEQLLLFEDYDLWIRLACRSEIEFIDQPLTRVRRSHDQHHGEGEHGDSMRAGRHRALEKVRRVVTDRRVRALVASQSARRHGPTRGVGDSAGGLHALVALHGLVAGPGAGAAEACGPAQCAASLPARPGSPPLGERLVITWWLRC